MSDIEINSILVSSIADLLLFSQMKTNVKLGYMTVMRMLSVSTIWALITVHVCQDIQEMVLNATVS